MKTLVAFFAGAFFTLVVYSVISQLNGDCHNKDHQKFAAQIQAERERRELIFKCGHLAEKELLAWTDKVVEFQECSCGKDGGK